MPIDPLSGLNAFLAVAETKSFTAAAAQLDVTPTAISKTIRLMEQRHGVALFQRTTRRVGLTEAGQALFLRLRPAAAEIADALAGLGDYRERPHGTLRITAPRNTRRYLMDEVVPRFRRACPDVTLDVSLNDALTDLVAEGYDAGIRLGESVEQDMVAVRITPPITWCIVGAPAYFAQAGRPASPEALVGHEALRYRFAGSQEIHRWGFRRGRRSFTVDVAGKLIVDDRELLLDLAAQGLGLAYVSDVESRTRVAEGRLARVLQGTIASDDGLYLYFPKRSQTQLKLRAFIDVLKALSAEANFAARFDATRHL